MTTPLLTTAGLRALDTFNGTTQAWLQTLTLHLYKNNRGTPLVTDTIANYTECDFDGYAAEATTTWGTPSLDGNNNDEYTEADKVFSMTGGVTPNTVYGYYFTDGAGDVVMVEDNGGGFAMTGNGFSYTVSPRFFVGQIVPPV